MSSGKGSAPRNCFSKQYRENWDQIFPQRSRGAGGAGGAEGENAKDAKPSTLDSRPSTHSIRTVPPHPDLP